MNYFLKILGSTKMKATDDAIEFFTKSGSLFWEKSSTILFGERAWSRVQKGDILIQAVEGKDSRLLSRDFSREI